MSKKPILSITKKDLEITYFSGKGAGGQKRNKTQNCVRIKHPASGAIVTGQEQKSRAANEKAAINRLVQHPKFDIWLKQQTGQYVLNEIERKKEIQKYVNEQMQEKYLKIETFDTEETTLFEDLKESITDIKDGKCKKIS